MDHQQPRGRHRPGENDTGEVRQVYRAIDRLEREANAPARRRRRHDIGMWVAAVLLLIAAAAVGAALALATVDSPQPRFFPNQTGGSK